MASPRPITETQLRLMKPALKAFARLHVLLYKLSGGRLFNRMGGGEICIVRMTGARSGQTREYPLMHVPYGDGIVLVASLAGSPRNPVWYYNLVAHPEFEVTVGRETRQLTARLASADEKRALWPLCCRIYPDFALYQRRTGRDIPLLICEPVAE